MMKHLKRLSALLVALAIFLTAIPASAFYEDEEAAISTQTINSANADSGATSANPSINSSATYTANGEYMSSITDSRGETTSYTYNESRGYVTSETNPKNVTTNYTYNGSELLTGVSVNNTSSVSYSYDGGKKLSSILSPSGTTYSFTYDGFARNLATKVGSRTLSSYTYNARSLPQTMTYGNGVVVSYGYDSLNRQTSFSINDVLKYQYRYDGVSRLSELTDLSLNRKTRYEYDILGRPTSEKVVDSLTNSLLSKLNLRYDDSKNRLAGYDVNIGGITNSTDYVYGGNTVAPDLITAVNRNGTQKISYTYDGLNRLSVRNLNNFLTEYTYLQGANANSTTTLVSSMKNGDDTLSYTYDELGNITSVSKNGTVIESYTYNDLNMLRSVTRGNDVYTYNYDNGGNILSVTKNGTTIKSYTYGDTEWKDLLTAYNGNAITYDNIGNPLTYYNGSTFTWSDGRKLTGITKGTDNISYTYDSNGLRATKNVNGTTTEYYWLDGTLYAEKTGNQYIYYHYDDNGIAYGFTVVNGTTTTDYYYIHNLQGDVIGIVDSTGTTVVEYTYDEWGKIFATTGSLATTIGEINPFRYRGYYYDAETDFYYCRARYYDPEICRWINADGYVSTGQCIISFNMFAYCNNSPIILTDSTGLCSYNGTYADFIRLNQGLPSMDCICTTAKKAVVLAEHHKKGTTNKANKQKHEDGQARKKRDQNGEKKNNHSGWKPNPNKRPKLDEIEIPFEDRLASLGIAIGGVLVVFYVVTNDITVYGVADDYTLPVLLPIVWDNFSKVFA